MISPYYSRRHGDSLEPRTNKPVGSIATAMQNNKKDILMDGTSPNTDESTSSTTNAGDSIAESLLESREQSSGASLENQHAQNPLQLKRGLLIVVSVAVLGVCCLYASMKTANANDSNSEEGIRIEGTVSIRRM